MCRCSTGAPGRGPGALPPLLAGGLFPYADEAVQANTCGPARYPFVPAWEGQSPGTGRRGPRQAPEFPGAWGWSPLPGSGAGRFTAPPPQAGASAPNYPPRPSVNIPAACIFTSTAVPARGHRCHPRPRRRPGQPDPPRSGSCVGRYHTDRQPKLEVQDTSVPTAGRSVPAIGLGRDGHGVPCLARAHRGAHLHTQANCP